MEDEEVAESWEEAADSGEIDRRLEKKLKITQKESRKSKSPPKVPIVIQDDSLPTGPPPQIRILKRPTSNGVVSSPNSTSRPALPVKSLAQREAEYAEARKRILGSASPEEEQEKPILDRPTRISQPEDSRQPNNVIRQPHLHQQGQDLKQQSVGVWGSHVHQGILFWGQGMVVALDAQPPLLHPSPLVLPPPALHALGSPLLTHRAEEALGVCHHSQEVFEVHVTVSCGNQNTAWTGAGIAIQAWLLAFTHQVWL
uniref:SUZ RNA binding domain containing 1 n=2 Tax=Laurasiatheria TaxID=314145 RepID=A0A8D1EVM7_PIG